MMTGREVCPRCRRSRRTCFCAHVAPVETKPLFVVLIHPKERRKRIGTGRMAHLCLPRSRLFEGLSFEGHPGVEAILADPGHRCFVLFPGAAALDARTLAADVATEAGRLVVFLVDATWPSARKILRLSPRLAALPRLTFEAGAPSEYGFRRQPAPHCLSTIEAVHRLLEILDPAAPREHLTAVFREMVAQQSSFAQ